MDVSKFMSLVFSTTWFMQPHKLISYGIFLKNLTEGNINFDEARKSLQAHIITPSGNREQLFKPEASTDSADNASLFDSFPKYSLLIVPLKGTMFKEDTWWSWGTDYIASVIREAGIHKNIKGIIIDTDSGGGATDSISPLIDAILFARKYKPVVGWADTAASAAYYAITSSDLVIAGNDISSSFGSIGVMASFVDIQPYWEKLGVKFHTIYAPESDYKNLPFENALKGNYKLLKSEILSPLAKKFQSDVRKFRNGKVDITQKGILNGKMYYANDAISFGLADELGNLDHAIKRVNELIKK